MIADMQYGDIYRDTDFKKFPEKYQIGRGEQGVLLAEPYKSEILPYWKFATPDIAEQSADTILTMFYTYKANGYFVGMDMSRKFLQMGYTRSRRYANHKGGKKYRGPVPADKKGQSGSHGRQELPRGPEDPIKAASAEIFYKRYEIAKNDPDYKILALKHKSGITHE